MQPIDNFRFVIAKKLDQTFIIAGFLIYLDAKVFMDSVGYAKDTYAIYRVNHVNGALSEVT
jgi:hypothetical protein